jgi:hypothetical protein
MWRLFLSRNIQARRPRSGLEEVHPGPLRGYELELVRQWR